MGATIATSAGNGVPISFPFEQAISHKKNGQKWPEFDTK
jgi:hypothetical protein